MVPNKVKIRSDCTLIDYFEIASGSVAVNGQKAAQDCGTLQISQSDNKDLGDPITIETYYRPSKHPTGERIRCHTTTAALKIDRGYSAKR
jgi:hypothetical protein